VSRMERTCRTCYNFHQVGYLCALPTKLHGNCNQKNGFRDWMPRCPKCGGEMVGFTDYDGLEAMADGKPLDKIRKGYMCKNEKCGHEEKVR